MGNFVLLFIMVFLVGQEFEEFPGKITNEVVNIANNDGFKIVQIDDDTFNVYFSGAGGIDKYMFTKESREECTDALTTLLKIHVTNEPNTVVTNEDCSSDIESIQDKDTILDIMLELLKRYGHEDLVNQFIDLEISESEMYNEFVESDKEKEKVAVNKEVNRFTIEEEKFRPYQEC